MLHPLYQEPFRPRFHFTPERNWMNDSNGMIYHDGDGLARPRQRFLRRRDVVKRSR